MPELDDVIEWLRRRGDVFINARRLAKAFKMSTKKAGYVLRELKEKGYLKVHRRRRGRFIVYKVNISILSKRRSKKSSVEGRVKLTFKRGSMRKTHVKSVWRRYKHPRKLSKSVKIMSSNYYSTSSSNGNS